jgi:hypothetical protein
MKVFHTMKKTGRRSCIGLNVLSGYCKSLLTSLASIECMTYHLFSLDAFESEYNPIQQNDCGEREWFGEYVIPIFQGALKLNSFCRVPW